MSSLSLNLYMKTDGAAAQQAIRTFVRHVNAQDYAAVEAMDVEETLYDVDDIFAAAITLREREGLFHLEFESASSLEVEVLVAFFHFLGATEIEISAFDSSTAETFYMDDACEYFDDHAARPWRWLPSPASGFVGRHVVVTGAFRDYTRPQLEALIAQKGGIIQKSVNGKTTLLVMGSKPGADKTGKAEALGVRTMDEDELLDVLAGGETLSVDPEAPPPESQGSPVIAYQYCFPDKDAPVVSLPGEVLDDLLAVLRGCGYLNEHYYQAQLESAREWYPGVAAKFEAYRHARDIPAELRGPLDPKTAWDISHLFRDHNTKITSYAPYLFEADEKGYGHALARIATYSGLPLEDIRYQSKPGTQGSFTLSCRFEGRPYSASFKFSENTFPKPFLRLLHDMASESEAWDFIFHTRPGEPSYAVIPRALAQGLARHGFLKPLHTRAI
ncbi:hypothetical protein PHLH8_27700 [Pseudomonas sp. Pc102]|uniref:BRCT domain-containing protein n=1 Tax=Pseudomonas sp. Pc102 TaxID=2678261 RepID=UPI001BD10D75|nr:BRCT domain-containing protein [Pseudomonas sp. Pc102]BBP83128.1 hypothetical protein PHLH8_27700 [Pseudomonas sp. Pc102]